VCAARVWRKVLRIQQVQGDGDDEVLVFAVCPTRGPAEWRVRAVTADAADTNGAATDADGGH